MKRLFVALLLVMTLCCACSKRDDKEVIQFASWGSQSEIAILKPIIAEYERKNSDYNNELVKMDLDQTSDGAVKVNIYTDKPYNEQIIVNKKPDNKYVILLPETTNTMNVKPDISGVSNVKNVDTLLDNIYKKLPEGDLLYPEDVLTEESMRDVASEIIREKILLNTQDEIPHSIAVMIDNYREEENIDKIYATIFCEHKSQKGILIGKNGSLLKTIGTQARLELEEIVEKKVYLELTVKVEKDWRKKDKTLKSFGYFDENK